jgi:large subunit ribosomal protein L23Ae
MKPVTTEKAVMKIESENVMTFETDKRLKKDEIKKEIEEVFNVKYVTIKSLSMLN